MIDFVRMMLEPSVVQVVAAVLTAFSGWVGWLFFLVTKTRRELFAQDSIHRAAETFTDTMLDVLELAVRNGTPLGRIDGYFDKGIDWISRRSTPGSTKVVKATTSALRTILEAKARARMLEIKKTVPADDGWRAPHVPTE